VCVLMPHNSTEQKSRAVRKAGSPLVEANTRLWLRQDAFRVIGGRRKGCFRNSSRISAVISSIISRVATWFSMANAVSSRLSQIAFDKPRNALGKGKWISLDQGRRNRGLVFRPARAMREFT